MRYKPAIVRIARTGGVREASERLLCTRGGRCHSRALLRTSQLVHTPLDQLEMLGTISINATSIARDEYNTSGIRRLTMGEKEISTRTREKEASP